MKKLFLYLTVFLVFIFLASFLITNKIFKDRMETRIQTPTDAENDIETTETIAKVKNNVYIVCIKNNQIVVCRNTFDEIYEYTGIDAEIIKECHSEIYETLKDGIRFDSIEKMFDFLESIAS